VVGGPGNCNGWVRKQGMNKNANDRATVGKEVYYVNPALPVEREHKARRFVWLQRAKLFQEEQ